MARKATHSGTCQCCGKLHKLPDGRLSKHGYTVDFGYFSGTCYGAGELPYELSCDLVKGFIAGAEKSGGLLREKAEAIRNYDTSTGVWVHVYIGWHWRRSKSSPSHRWELLPWDKITTRTIGASGNWDAYEILTGYENPVDGKPHSLSTYEKGRGREAAARYLASNRAESFEREAKSCDRYAAWQRERIKDWKPGELTPIGG